MTIVEIILAVVVVLLVFKVMGLSYRVRRIHKHLLHVKKREREKFLNEMDRDVEKLLESFKIEIVENDNKKTTKSPSRENGANKHQTKKGPKKVRKNTSQKKK